MRSTIRYVDLDVHKETIVIGVAEEHGSEPEILAKIPHQWPTLHKQLKRLGPRASLRCCYEAGPTGYGVYRKLKAADIQCIVVAPSLIPEQKGNRVKTDRRGVSHNLWEFRGRNTVVWETSVDLRQSGNANR